FADVVTQQIQPVLLVTTLRSRERQQNVALFPRTAGGKIAVHGTLGTLRREVPAPAPQLRIRLLESHRMSLTAGVITSCYRMSARDSRRRVPLILSPLRRLRRRHSPF